MGKRKSLHDEQTPMPLILARQALVKGLRPSKINNPEWRRDMLMPTSGRLAPVEGSEECRRI
jgi:hypothetical protein